MTGNQVAGKKTVVQQDGFNKSCSSPAIGLLLGLWLTHTRWTRTLTSLMHHWWTRVWAYSRASPQGLDDTARNFPGLPTAQKSLEWLLQKMKPWTWWRTRRDERQAIGNLSRGRSTPLVDQHSYPCDSTLDSLFSKRRVERNQEVTDHQSQGLGCWMGWGLGNNYQSQPLVFYLLKVDSLAASVDSLKLRQEDTLPL